MRRPVCRIARGSKRSVKHGQIRWGWIIFVTVTLGPWGGPYNNNGKDTVRHRFTAHLAHKRDYPPFPGMVVGVSGFVDERADATPDEPAAAAAAVPADDSGGAAHTLKAYRQDFHAIAALLTDKVPEQLALNAITKDAMRRAFAAYGATHEPASIRRGRRRLRLLFDGQRPPITKWRCDWQLQLRLAPADRAPQVRVVGYRKPSA
jgi:hypothetical protein